MTLAQTQCSAESEIFVFRRRFLINSAGINMPSNGYIPCASCRVCPTHLPAGETSKCSGIHPADCREMIQ